MKPDLAVETPSWGPELRRLMRDSEFLAGFPEGISAEEMYQELVTRRTNVVTSATVIDVADYMTELYGPGKTGKR